MYIVGAEIRLEVGPTVRLEGRGGGMVMNAHSVLNSQPLLCFTPTRPLPPFPPFLLAQNLSLQHFVTSHCANTNLMMALVIKNTLWREDLHYKTGG